MVERQDIERLVVAQFHGMAREGRWSERRQPMS
jgi:hypothetical protein